MNRIEDIDARYDFTEEEKNAMARQVTEKEMACLDVENEKKAAVEGYNNKIKAAQEEIIYLSRCVQNGFENRSYRCRVEKDSLRQVRVYRDIKTENVVKEEPFEPDDYQDNLPFDERKDING